MRNSFTDALAVSINTAFRKSGMSAEDFVLYLEETRDNLVTFEFTDTSVTFHAYIDSCEVHEGVYQFYLVDNQWYCKH